jgi:hypothetical protein
MGLREGFVVSTVSRPLLHRSLRVNDWADSFRVNEAARISEVELLGDALGDGLGDVPGDGVRLGDGNGKSWSSSSSLIGMDGGFVGHEFALGHTGQTLLASASHALRTCSSSPWSDDRLLLSTSSTVISSDVAFLLATYGQ